MTTSLTMVEADGAGTWARTTVARSSPATTLTRRTGAQERSVACMVQSLWSEGGQIGARSREGIVNAPPEVKPESAPGPWSFFASGRLRREVELWLSENQCD